MRAKWLHKPKASPYWHYDYVVRGRRFHGSTGSAKLPEARRFVDRHRAAAVAGTREARRPEMTVNAAFGRWHAEHGRHLREAENLMPRLERLLASLGKDRLLSDIDGAALATHAARIRADLSATTVNHDLKTLRRVLRRARAWGVAVPEVLAFGEFMLPEPAPRKRYLSAEEERRLLPLLPPDLRTMVQFALATGARLESVITLRWADVDDAEGLVTFRGVKSEREGEVHTLPVTAGLRALLGSRRGQHPEFVFTYVCARRTRDRLGRVREEGRRYPFSATGWRRTWKRVLAAAGIGDFRFHDNRHTAGTRILRRTGNLRLAQRMLGHTRIETTVRYAHVLLDDLAEGMAAMSRNPHEEEAGAGCTPAGQVVPVAQQTRIAKDAGT